MSRDSFLQTVSVIDTETTNLDPAKAEIVEIAGATYNGHSWLVSDMLLGSVNRIPPEASAKNHISQRMIAGLPIFSESVDKVKVVLGWDNRYIVAHNCQYDQTVLAVAWETSGLSDDTEKAVDRSNWICTHRLSKHLLHGVDFPDMQYNLNYLRYKLDLPIPDDTVSHRAGADTLTCAILFEFLLDYAIATGAVCDNHTVGDQLVNLCWSPIKMKSWPFGKNKGRLLSEIETDYYMWAIGNMDSLNEDYESYDPDLAASVASELESRINA